ncbi:phospholipid--sterol O-acyltransferase isoform X2 [Cryptomeria japonica]|uniref:phospholipid--sterol O-acyltransferase isoform X2 n=1 Tax=Cryptomeria japonica TaxID=3369 RepID=UPI0027D9E8E8|nr:phospholipid--sterol O-acyltransferase isoform X2 [Cryptomeria japonica]
MLLLIASTPGEGETWGDNNGKLSGVTIQSLSSTQLRAWAMLDCPFSCLNFHPLDSVWLDTRKVISVVNCWLKCMMLDPYNQTDNPECKSRPDAGLSAITELDPGYITGPLSSVWRDWVKWCVEFGIDANAILAVPYDWRLSASMLEERDLYFHKLKLTFETALKLRGGPSLVFAHSMGNNVFRYFLEWLKLEIAPKLYNQWLDDHIYAYFAVGAPFLGAVETIKATLSGVTFGLPVPEGTSRLMCNSFGSSLWMLPFSEHCRRDHIYWKSFFDGIKREGYNVHCDEKEYTSNFSGWPVDLVNIEIPVSPDAAYPGISKEAEAATSSFECGIPLQQSFSAREVADGTLFNEIGDIDPNSKTVLHQLHKFYHNDPVLNSLTPWDRPPIKNIFCIYGIDLKTEVGYHFAPSGKPYPDNWIVTDIIYEVEGGTLQSRSGNPVHGNPTKASGDTTVPYHSLSWCKTWLGSHVNITRTPQSEHDGSDVQEALNIERQHGRDFIPNMTRDNRLKYITFYEDGESIPGKRTAVWELDKVNHRNLVQSPVIMRELWLEMWHSFHPDTKTKFVSKAKRGPLRDEECYWDYAKARCALPDHCEYRYVFGDVHLGQSCRLKASPADLLHHYL